MNNCIHALSIICWEAEFSDSLEIQYLDMANYHKTSSLGI